MSKNFLTASDRMRLASWMEKEYVKDGKVTATYPVIAAAAAQHFGIAVTQQNIRRTAEVMEWKTTQPVNGGLAMYVEIRAVVSWLNRNFPGWRDQQPPK